MPDKFHWDKWGMLPALLFTLGLAYVSLVLMGDESRWPVHFNASGAADAWESAHGGLPFVVIVHLIVLAIFFLLDEAFVGFGRWNFIAPLAAWSSGTIFGMFLEAYWTMSPEAASPIPLPFSVWFWTMNGLGVFLAWALNGLRRPPAPAPASGEPARKLPDWSTQTSWFYWERVEGRWMDAILVLVVLLLGICLWRFPPRSLLEMAVIVGPAALCVLVFGGFHVFIDRERIQLRWGWLRIPCLNVRMADLVEAEVVEFGALRRFCGYGIRYGPKVGWGFVLRDNGVFLKTRKGRRVTISVKDPKYVAELISRAMEDATAKDGAT